MTGQYTKFEDWMIGKRVKENSSGDLGTIIGVYDVDSEMYSFDRQGVWVTWDCEHPENELHIFLEDVEFIDERPDEIKMVYNIPLRDYFAAHAPTPVGSMSMEEHCAYRWRYADTMLKTREQ